MRPGDRHVRGAAAEDGLGAVGWVATLPKAGDCGDGAVVYNAWGWI